jgi:hypothetical protein
LFERLKELYGWLKELYETILSARGGGDGNSLLGKQLQSAIIAPFRMPVL